MAARDSGALLGAQLCALLAYNHDSIEIHLQAIRDLVTNGADINFRDLNNNGNTAIHLAIEQNIPRVVKELLKYNPDLTIINEDGETPKEYSDKLQRVNISKLIDGMQEEMELSTSTILKELICELRFNGDIDSFCLSINNLNNHKYKILNVNAASLSLEVALNLLRNEKFIQCINNSTYFFIFVFPICESKENFKVENHLKHLNKSVIENEIKIRPSIVQLRFTSGEHLVLFKEKSDCKFASLTDDSIIDDQMSNDLKTVFQQFYFCGAVNHNNKDNILETTIDNASFQNLIDHAVEYNNCLILRFINLFKFTAQVQTNHEIFIKTNNLDGLASLLDFPFNYNLMNNLTNTQNSCIVIKNDCFVMSAIKNKRLDCLKLILNYETLVFRLRFSRSRLKLAFANKYFDAVTELLRRDILFPNNFSLDLIKDSETVKAIIEKRQAFHENIKIGNMVSVAKYVSENKNLQYAFNLKNQSAYATAHNNKQYEILALFKENNFCFAPYEKEKLINFEQTHKELERLAMLPYFSNPKNSYIIHLMNHSKCLNDNFNSKVSFDKILSFYRKLNEILEVKLIVKFFEFIDDFEVIFDFDSKNVGKANPAYTDEGISGLTYYYKIPCHIYIGAKHNEHEVMGCLIHELTHLAMQLLYENSAKPYRVKDTEREKEFNDISSRIFDEIQNDENKFDKIITDVTKYYPEDVFHVELIVRVPHLCAFYTHQSEELRNQKNLCHDLFDYFHNNVLKDLEKEIPKWKRKQKINRLNTEFGAVQQLKKYEYEFEPLEMEFFLQDKCSPEVRIKIIESRVPLITSFKYFTYLNHNGTGCIFLDASVLEDKNNLRKILDLVNANNQVLSLLMLCGSNICSELNQLFTLNINLFLIGKKSFCEQAIDLIQQSIRSSFKALLDQINFYDFTKESQKEFLNIEIKFQDNDMKLNDIVDENSNLLKLIFLEEILTSLKLHIRVPIVKKTFRDINTNLFITRKFLNNRRSNEISTDEFISEFLFKNVAIIYGKAGTGKSTILFHIYKKLISEESEHKTKWIELIDLKRCVDIFNEFLNDKDKPTFINFTKKLYKKATELEKKLFEDFHAEGKTIFLLDGFDEISPKFKNIVLDLLKSFDKRSGNKLCVTSRTHLKQVLEKTLNYNLLSYSLKHFEFREKVNFLMQRNDSMTETTATSILNMQRNFYDNQKSLFSTPMLLHMIAEISDTSKDGIILNMNYFAVYEKFIEKVLEKWIDKGEIAKKTQTRLNVSRLNVLEIHQQLSLYYLFKNEDRANLESILLNAELSFDEISLIGLIDIESVDNFQFLHQTFAEYFVAYFIVSKIKLKEKNNSSDLDIFLKVMIDVDFRDIKKLVESEILTNIELLNALEIFLQINLTREECKTLIFTKTGFYMRNMIMHCVGRTEILLRLIEIAKSFLERSEFVTLLSETDGLGDRAFDLVLMHNSNIADVNALWQGMKDNFSRDECKEFILAKTGQNKRNIFTRCAEKAENIKILQQLIEIAKSFLEQNEFVSLLNESDYAGARFFDHAIRSNSNIDDVNALWQVMAHNLSKEECKEFIMAKTGEIKQNLIMRCAQRPEKTGFIHQFMAIAKSCLEQNEFISFLKQTDKAENRAFDYIFIFSTNIDVLNTLWQAISDNLSRDECKEFITAKAGELKRNVIMLCAIRSETKILLHLIEIAKSYLKQDEFVSLLSETDINGLKAFDHAIMFNSNIDVVSAFWQVMQDNLSRDECKQLLMAETGQLNSLLKCVSYQNIFLVLFKLIEIGKSFLDDGEFHKWLKEVDCEEDNMFDYAVLSIYTDQDFVNSVWKVMVEYSSVEELKNMILGKKGITQYNTFMRCAKETKKLDKLKTLIEIAKSLLTETEFIVWLIATDAEGKNAFDYGLSNNFKSSDTIWKTLIEHLSEEIIKVRIIGKETPVSSEYLLEFPTPPN